MELSEPTRKTLEEFFVCLVEYQLAGRLMLFQGLCSHAEMVGAINVVQSIIGHARGVELVTTVTARPQTEGWKNRDGSNKGWKFVDLNAAYVELSRPDHKCDYCNKVP